MSWNYRVMRFQSNPAVHWDKEQEIYLVINDVYYDKDGTPNGYGDVGRDRRGETVHGESIEDMRDILKRMTEALDKPILYGGDRWPQEYKPALNQIP